MDIEVGTERGNMWAIKTGSWRQRALTGIATALAFTSPAARSQVCITAGLLGTGCRRASSAMVGVGKSFGHRLFPDFSFRVALLQVPEFLLDLIQLRKRNLDGLR